MEKGMLWNQVLDPVTKGYDDVAEWYTLIGFKLSWSGHIHAMKKMQLHEVYTMAYDN